MNQNTQDSYSAPAAGSSAYYSTLVLDLERRHAVTALLAVYGEMRRVVDKTDDANIARIKLAWWRNQIAELTDGTPAHPACLALQPSFRKFNLDPATMQELVDGLELELLQTRYLDFVALERYCQMVAGSLSALVASISGRGGNSDAVREYARLLGTGVYLSRIIRDVGEHARIGRIYIPVNELKQFQVPAADILNARHSEAFAALMRFQYERASGYLDSARLTLPSKARREQRCGLIMGAIHHALLGEIKADGFQVLHHKVALTPIRKLWCTWKLLIF